MKATIKRSTLMELNSALSCVTGSNDYKYFTISFANNGICGYTEDGKHELRISKPFGDGESADGAGEATIVFKHFDYIVKKFAGDEVLVNIDGDHLHMVCGAAEILLIGAKHELRPMSSVQGATVLLGVSGDYINAVMEKVGFCGSSNRMGRDILKSIHVSTKDGYSSFTATDGYRLATWKQTAKGDDCEATIPYSTWKIATKLFKKSEHVTVKLGKKIEFASTGMLLQSQIPFGEYPNTERLFPTSFTADIEMDRNELIRTIDRCEMFKDDASDISVVRFETADSSILKVSAISSEIGDFAEEIWDAKISSDWKSAFSVEYLKNALTVIDDDVIVMHCVGERKPVIITGKTNDAERHLVLPMMVR